MGEVPKIVRERLQALEAESGHPDADLLAAFAEQSLAGDEHGLVLEHLARCSDCRQVVALATPARAQETAAAAPAIAESARAWHEWTIFRWGGLAAALTVILFAVFLARPRPRPAQEATAPAIEANNGAPAQRVAPESAAADQAKANKPAVPAKQQAVVASRQKAERDQVLDKLAAKPAQGRQEAPVSPAAGAVVGGRADQVSEQRAASAAAKTDSRHQKATAQNEVVTVETAPGLEGSVYADKPKTAAKETASATSHKLIAPAAPAGTAGGVAQSKDRAAAPSAPPSRSLYAKTVAGTRWSISSAGAVERSDDGGRTWHDRYIKDGVFFRAIAAVGSDVWAGGSGGALFHSLDAGESWSPVPVRSGDQRLQGDITQIQAQDATRVQIVTSTSQTWITTDGGKTWSER